MGLSLEGSFVWRGYGSNVSLYREGVDLSVAPSLNQAFGGVHFLDTSSGFFEVPSNGEHGLPAQSWCHCTWHA